MASDRTSPAKRPALLEAVRADRHGLNGASWSGTLALLGIANQAEAVAMDPDLPKSTTYLYRDVWYPTARALLVAPAFLKLAERDGLLAYWRDKGFPEGCRLVETPPAHLECTGVWQ